MAKSRDEYFDKYDGIYAEISQATRFDESTDLSTTYLGNMDMTRDKTIKAEEKLPNFWTRVYKWQVTRQYRM